MPKRVPTSLLFSETDLRRARALFTMGYVQTSRSAGWIQCGDAHLQPGEPVMRALRFVRDSSPIRDGVFYRAFTHPSPRPDWFVFEWQRCTDPQCDYARRTVLGLM